MRYVCSITSHTFDPLKFLVKPFGVDHIAITAVIGDQRVTVSGIPCHLDDFTKNLSKAVVVYPIDVNALYHRADLDTVRNDVLADVASRNIRFPTFTDLITPIRSTFSGELVFQNNGQVINTLVEEVVDMVLIHPVKWDMLIHKSISNLPEKSSVNFLNIGLGPSLMKRVEGAFVEYVGPCCQVINLSGNILASKPIVKQVPVAIIGMAVDMPGARTVSELWKILESGRSTLSTVFQPNLRCGTTYLHVKINVDSGGQVSIRRLHCKYTTWSISQDEYWQLCKWNW